MTLLLGSVVFLCVFLAGALTAFVPDYGFKDVSREVL